MAHYNLYDSLGLDRSSDPAALAREIDSRIQSGNTWNPGGMDELQVARAILGDPARRAAYDQRLGDPNAPAVTPDSLRQLANADMTPLTGRPYQYGPSSSTSSVSSLPPSSAVAHPQVDSGMAKKKRSVWPGVAAAVALLALAGGGAWWLLQQQSAGQEWDEPYAAVAADFPDVIAATDGGRGVNGLTCTSRELDAGQEAKIRCADETQGITVVRYASDQERDAAVPESDSVERYGNEVCEFNSAEITDQDAEAYYMAPDGQLSEYLILVNGDGAADLRLRLPIC